MQISDRFDVRDIEVLDASQPGDVRLAIKDDVGGEHKQWFSFRASGVRGVPCVFRVEQVPMRPFINGLIESLEKSQSNATSP